MPIFIAILIVLIGGAMEGAFVLPLKYTTKWRWENTWGAGSLFALLLIPWPAAFLSVPDLWSVYQQASWGAIAAALLFGAGWGAGGVFLGLGVDAIGMSLGVSLVMSLNAVVGSIVPLVMQHPEQIFQPSGLVLMAGVAVMILGVALCGGAARVKEKEVGLSGSGKKTSFKAGLVLCVLAAVLSALVNFGLIFGDEIRQIALARGAAPGNAVNAVWALEFTTSFLVSIGYCVYLMKKNQSFRLFGARGTRGYWAMAVLMGLVWGAGIIVYGFGVSQLGKLGAFLGFPVMLTGCILAGNILGVATGEWAGVSWRAKRLMLAGVAVLLVAVVILGISNQLV